MRIAAICILTTIALGIGTSAGAAVKLGRPAPPLSGSDVNGAYFDLADHRGKWVYVDFWATWCAPCMKALPDVVELSERTAERSDLLVVGVSLDDSLTAGRLASVVSKAGITYPVVFEGTGKNSAAADAWGVSAIPATFLIDPEGRVAGVDVPPSYVEQVVAESKGAKERPAAGRASAPSQSEGPVFHTRDLLLPDSPSSGDSRMRDLEVRTEISTKTPLRKYRVSVLFAEPSGRKGELYRAWRYNITLTDSPGQRNRFLTEISPAPGKLVGLDLASLGQAKLPGKVDPDMPPISATYSAADSLHTIVIPVPLAATRLYYSLAVYDELQRQYIESGLVQVEL